MRQEFIKTLHCDYGTLELPFSALGPHALVSSVCQSHRAAHQNIYVLGSVDPSGADPADVMFIRSTDDGATWNDPLRVNDDPQGNGAHQWFGTMSVAPNGRIDAIWNDTRNIQRRTGSLLLAHHAAGRDERSER